MTKPSIPITGTHINHSQEFSTVRQLNSAARKWNKILRESHKNSEENDNWLFDPVPRHKVTFYNGKS